MNKDTKTVAIPSSYEYCKEDLYKINEKLDMLFSEIIELKRNNELKDLDRTLDECKRKVEDANCELNYRQDDKRYIYNKYDNIESSYRNINRNNNSYMEEGIY